MASRNGRAEIDLDCSIGDIVFLKDIKNLRKKAHLWQLDNVGNTFNFLIQRRRLRNSRSIVSTECATLIETKAP